MNLEKLFVMQRKLDDHILEEHPELKNQSNLDWKILALQVELGECANEWRGFKVWSTDQESRIEELIECDECGGSGRSFTGYCGNCLGGYVGVRNPLLEEYVDCLHFILSIGNELQFGNYPLIGKTPKTKTFTHMFLITYESINNFYRTWQLGNEELTEVEYTVIFGCFLTLGEMLGFTWEQIEQAYIQKNEVNHERQESGY